MKHGESGFTIIEIAVTVGIVALIAGAATATIFHAFNDTKRTNDHMTTVRHLENAAYWMGRDTRMADYLSTTNLTSPAILILKWTEWGYGTDSVYHQVTYSVDNVSANVGNLKRKHESSTGTNEQILVANYIYYNPADPGNSTNVTYQSPMLNLKVATSFGSTLAKKEFQIYRRPNFMSG